MTASVHAWHELLADSAMEGVEEGFLDETDNTILKISETHTALPKTAEHGWKELVSDPSLSEVETSEIRKNQESSVQAEIGHKDWDHYLSAFSLNEEDPTAFMALEVHKEQGGQDVEISDAIDIKKYQKNSFDIGSKSTANVLGGVENKPIISKADEQGGLNQELDSSSLNSVHVSENLSFPTKSKRLPDPAFEHDPDGENFYETSKSGVSSGSPATGLDSEMAFQSGIISGTNMLPSGNTARSLEKTSEIMRRPNSVPLRTSERRHLISKHSPAISNANDLWQTESIIRPNSAPATEAEDLMQIRVEDRKILPTDANNDSNVMFQLSRNLSSTNSGVSEMKAFQARSQSALDIYGNYYFPTQKPSVPRANSAPLLGNTGKHVTVTTAPAHFPSEKAPTKSDQAGHDHQNRAVKMGDWESSLKQRKISGADEDVLHNVRSGTKRNSGDKTLREAEESSIGNVSSNSTSAQTSYSRTARTNSRLATGINAKELTNEKKTVPLEDFSHPLGDGMYGTNPDDDINEDFVLSRGRKVTNISNAEEELKRSLQDGSQHIIVHNVHDASDTKDEQNSPLLVDLELNANVVSSSNTHQIFTTGRRDQTESKSGISNVATSRETAENLPVRPLTIGDSLTIASTFAYRPISPFQPNLYPTGAATPISMLPSTTSVTTTHLSASQYSEGSLDEDEEREGDMSARERLQPLGRDGLEVKQGPPWGITMPLFQPNSRDSSLASSDSSGSNTQLSVLQTTSNQQLKLEAEPLQSMSSISSETDLSQKASVKSLEPKEPIGAKMMKDAGNLRTPIRKFLQLNANDGDSPVSKILGPTFKATQKMLEELQRRPLGAYDEDLKPPFTGSENARNTNDRDTSVEREAAVASKRPTSTSHASLEGPEERIVKESQDRRHSYSHVSAASWEEAGSYHELPIDQVASNLTSMTTTNIEGVGSTRSSMVDGLRKVGDSKPSRRTTPTSADELHSASSASRDVVHDFLTNQQTPYMTSVTTTRIDVLSSSRNSVADGLQNDQVSRPFSKGKIQQPTTEIPAITTDHHASTTRTPLVSLKDGMSQKAVDDLAGSHSRRSEIHKTQQASGLTDSTLANSIGLSSHLVSSDVGTCNQGNTEPEKKKLENLLESRHDASDMSEFDRVASESISWSNAVVNQFREEMKSVDLSVQEGFLDSKDDITLVNEPRTTTSILDSGLSESSSNEEMYRPKRLPRLSPGDGSVGIYDVRRSSGPGSTNRKRLALGKKVRESSKPLHMESIYVSDSATGTSDTDRDIQGGPRTQRSVYVSEETTTGTERVDNGVDSGPEGQSTPKSEDVSTRTSDVALLPGGFSAGDSSKSKTDMYLGVGNSMFDSPTKSSRSRFSTYEIEKPTYAFTEYKPSRQDQPLFSTFEIDKPLRANLPETSRNGTLTRGYANFETNVLAEPQESNVMRQKSAAKVEHTWSISKPVMSQLGTGAVPSASHDIYREPRTTAQQNFMQPTSHQHEQRHRHEPRHQKTVPKPVVQHAKDQTTERSKSQKDLDKRGTTVRKKSVADIILENMIEDEQEHKKRQKKFEMKQEQTTQDLNLLWERFQGVFGKTSSSSRASKRSSQVRARPSRESTPTDFSLASSSVVSSSENRNIDRQSTDISTESDEEFERFLRRIREIQSSESSYQEDNGSMTSSRAPSNMARVRHRQAESETTSSERSQHKPRHKSVDSSTSMTSTATSKDRRVRRNIPQSSSQERRPRKAARQTVNNPVVISSSVTDKDSEMPVSLPMWLSVKNKEMTKQGKVSSSACTCGAKSRKEKQKTLGVRDIGVNCPTPPILAQEFPPVATDIAVLKAGPVEDIVSNPISPPASLVKLSLQDAFMYSKQDFIERSRERVKKVKEKCEERKHEKTTGAQVVVVLPSEKMKAKKEDKKPDEDKMQDMKSTKQFEQLQRKKPRPMTTKEIRDVNKRMYKNLPEVRKRRDEERRAAFYKANRLRAQLYGKHVRNTNRIFTAV